jgi:hypothetical protein
MKGDCGGSRNNILIATLVTSSITRSNSGSYASGRQTMSSTKGQDNQLAASGSSSTKHDSLAAPHMSLEAQAWRLLVANRVTEHLPLTNNAMDSMHDADDTTTDADPIGFTAQVNWNTVGRNHRRVEDADQDNRMPWRDDNGVEYATFSYPVPCAACIANNTTVMESTVTLQAARAYAKAGHADWAWEALDALFAVQGSNGFVPRYRYRPGNTTHHNDTTAKGESTCFQGSFPLWTLFGTVPEKYLPPPTSLGRKAGLKASGRLSAPPLHATITLDIFYESNQTDYDVSRLLTNFNRIYRYHEFLHTRVMHGCTANSGGDFHQNDAGEVPCFNVLHPWETLIEPNSPIWVDALAPISKLISQRNWSIGFDVPPQVKLEFDHPSEEVYTSMLFLLECMANVTSRCDENNATHYEYGHDDDFCHDASISLEEQILVHCPFAMVDVGYAAILSKANTDLLQMAQVLRGFHQQSKALRTALTQVDVWQQQSQDILSSLWQDSSSNHTTSSFFSKSIRFPPGPNHTFVIENATTRSLALPIAYNFLAMWDDNDLPQLQMDAATNQLLQREGEFSFNCDGFPIWSVGGCNRYSSRANALETRDSFSSSVYPFLNEMIASGLSRHGALGIGHFVVTTTLNMICSFQNITEQVLDLESTCLTTQNVTFARAYHHRTGFPVSLSECGMTSTETAAAVYNMMIPDKPYDYIPEPPIRNSWVIVLIAVELVVAFSIGVSFLILSLNLMRRLKADNDGDAFVQMLRSNQDTLTDMYDKDGYFCWEDALSSPTSSADDANALPPEQQSLTGQQRQRELNAAEATTQDDDIYNKFASALNPLNYIPENKE